MKDELQQLLEAWPVLLAAGGMAAVVLNDPTDRPTEHRVADLVRSLASDPGNGGAQPA